MYIYIDKYKKKNKNEIKKTYLQKIQYVKFAINPILELTKMFAFAFQVDVCVA